MDVLSATRTLSASAYIANSEAPDDYWLEGEKVRVEIERTDNDEVRIGVHIAPHQVEAAGIYLSRAEAIRLVLAVAAAVGDR